MYKAQQDQRQEADGKQSETAENVNGFRVDFTELDGACCGGHDQRDRGQRREDHYSVEGEYLM